jgi:hypothetical protein
MKINAIQNQNWDFQIQKTEWKFVFGIALFLIGLTSIPYLFGYLTAPLEKQFMGIMLDVPDHVQYFSWMRELSQANLAANKLTSELNKPVFFNLLWWGLGRLGNIFNFDYPVIYQIMRVIAPICFLPIAYWFCALYFKDLWKRRVAYLTICLTSGLGWILIVLKYTLTQGELLYPLDVFIAEGNTFLCILGYPHFIAALLYIAVFGLVLIGEQTNKYSYSVAAGFFALFLGWQHAYDLIIVYGVLGAYGTLKIVRDRRIPKYLLISGIMVVAISCWPAVYSVLLTSLDPLWEEVLAQFANAGVYTPNLLHLPVLLGAPFLLALASAIKYNPLRVDQRSDLSLFLSAWFWITFVLVYLPVDYQIHLINGWQLPISIYSTMGLFDLLIPLFKSKLPMSRLRNWNWSLGIPVVFLVFISLTNIYLWFWRFVDLSRHDYPYYLYKDELQIMEWLEANGEPSDVVLSSLNIGQYIPALTGKHAFLAHWAQTVDYHEKEALVKKFYDDNFDHGMRENFLRDFQIDFIFWGSAEKALGNFNPSTADYLLLAYRLPKAEVYRVR